MTVIQETPQRTGGQRGMLPSTWINRSLRVSYLDAYGGGAETSGTYLDHCALGLIVNMGGAKTLIAWDRLVLVELADG